MSFEIMDDEQTASSAGEKQEVEHRPYSITEYDETAGALSVLAVKYKDVVFAVSTKEGMEEAKQARAQLRGYRTNLETMRKSIKAPALERCRLIDAEAKDITEKLTALEKPIALQIEAEEARKEQEKQSKLNAEIARVQVLRARIANITAIADTAYPNSDSCQHALVKVKAIEINELQFEELQPDAQQAKDAALFRLQNLFAQYTASEAEAEQIRIDRAKLAQLEAESAARRAEDDRKAAEERARLQREQDERINAEVARLEAEQAEQRRKDEEHARQVREAQAAEQRRLDEQAAALKRQQDEAAAAERQRQSEANAAEERVRAAAPLLLKAIKALRAQFIGACFDSEEDAIAHNIPALVETDAAIQAAQ